MAKQSAEESYHKLAQRYNQLMDIIGQLNQTYQLDILLEQILQAAIDLTSTESASIALLHETSGELYFEAAYGPLAIPQDLWGRLAIPLDNSIAGWVFTNGKPQLVKDVHADERWFSGVDDDTRMKTRDMLSVPLKTREQTIGTVQVINKVLGQNWTDEDIRMLEAFANQAAIAIQNARYIAAEISRQRMEKELGIAKDIQMTLLPDECPSIEGWDFAAAYHAARQVGGDFYDFFSPSGHLGMLIADVADKGVPAGLFMAACRTLFRSTALTLDGPAEVMEHANLLIESDLGDSGLFVTVFYALMDTDTGSLRYSNGGHNLPLWFRHETAEITELQAKGMALGVLDVATFEEREVHILPGDVLIFYTDGVIDAMNESRELFDLGRLRDLLSRHADKGASEILENVLTAVSEFAGETPQVDDITIFVVKRAFEGSQ